MSAPLYAWTFEPLSPAVRRALERAAGAEDVVHVAAMPDVHLAEDVCVGTALATTRLLYPAAIGGDLGCGVAALRAEVAAAAAAEPRAAGRLLEGLQRLVPALKHAALQPIPEDLAPDLSASPLRRLAEREGRRQLGTLGRGNHFLELCADDAGWLWILVHSGSRSLGPAIQAHHRARARPAAGGLEALAADSEEGRMYLADLAWAARWAAASRQQMLAAAAALVEQELGGTPDLDSYLDCDHDHVRRERHGGRDLWVHRKGAIPAAAGERGIIPGSMGTASFLVEGRGCPEALGSSAHGAGRRLSRTEARERLRTSDLRAQVGALRYDERKAARLVAEAPGAYKDIHAVMRAQRELTRAVARLRPILNHKGV